ENLGVGGEIHLAQDLDAALVEDLRQDVGSLHHRPVGVDLETGEVDEDHAGRVEGPGACLEGPDRGEGLGVVLGEDRAPALEGLGAQGSEVAAVEFQGAQPSLAGEVLAPGGGQILRAAPRKEGAPGKALLRLLEDGCGLLRSSGGQLEFGPEEKGRERVGSEAHAALCEPTRQRQITGVASEAEGSRPATLTGLRFFGERPPRLGVPGPGGGRPGEAEDIAAAGTALPKRVPRRMEEPLETVGGTIPRPLDAQGETLWRELLGAPERLLCRGPAAFATVQRREVEKRGEDLAFRGALEIRHGAL